MYTFKQACVELRRKNYSLDEIAKMTGRPKSSVYVHIRDLPLSAEKVRASRIANGKWIRAFAIARRGKSTRTFKAFTKWESNLVMLIAHFMFDGEIRRAGCSYNNRNQILIDRVESLMKCIYDLPPTRYYNAATSVHRISYFNVALGAFIRTRATELLRRIEEMPRDSKLAFIKAFFDDEGCMDYRPLRNLRRVRGYQKDIRVLFLVQKLLATFGISSNFKKPNEIVIAGKENLARFRTTVGFSKGVYINGNRTNSIWKSSLEKRELLDRAIASYKPIGSDGVHRIAKN